MIAIPSGRCVRHSVIYIFHADELDSDYSLRVSFSA